MTEVEIPQAYLVLLQGTAMTLFVRKMMRFRVIFIPFPHAKNRFDHQIACMLADMGGQSVIV